MKLTPLAKYTWFLLIYNVGVVLWGAYVRATGSGAGCGSHWPTCNGQIIPRPERIETLIEFSHRLTSGLSGLLVIALVVWAIIIYERGHIVRKGAWLSFAFIIIEGALGASLVIFGWVANDDSSIRALVVALHLINTFILLAAIALTAWWASGGEPFSLRGQPARTLWLLGLGLLGILTIGASGAITALGDTLFPADTFIQGLQQDIDPSAHFLIQLRVIHPAIGLIVGIYLGILSITMLPAQPSAQLKRLSQTLFLLIAGQFMVGGITLVLAAPVAMQLAHLLTADLVWLALVIFSAAVLTQPAASPIREEAVPQPVGD